MKGVSQKDGHGDFLLLWRKLSCLSICFVVVVFGGGWGGGVSTGGGLLEFNLVRWVCVCVWWGGGGC